MLYKLNSINRWTSLLVEWAFAPFTFLLSLSSSFGGSKVAKEILRKEMWTNRDIAEHLQISESTVENQLSKAISFMREHLTKYYDYLLSLIAFIFINQAK